MLVRGSIESAKVYLIEHGRIIEVLTLKVEGKVAEAAAPQVGSAPG
jgi:hypothetical protein